jgi:hypothetical protein
MVRVLVVIPPRVVAPREHAQAPRVERRVDEREPDAQERRSAARGGALVLDLDVGVVGVGVGVGVVAEDFDATDGFLFPARGRRAREATSGKASEAELKGVDGGD